MPDLSAPWFPPLALLGFLLASGLMIWRLEALSARGFQGTVLGTLITPYCSGLGNLIFVLLMLRQAGGGGEVLVNALVNNATNLTLLLGLPALLWALAVIPIRRKGRGPSKRARQQLQLSRLSLLLTLVAAGFFLAITWLLARDGSLDRADGWTLIALFLFWQSYSVYEVLRDHVSEKQSLSPGLVLDLGLLLLSAGGQFWTIEYLVGWVMENGDGLLSPDHLGWLSGWLMVTPNALLALFYARRNRPEIVYSSQVGDGHICIPLCIGLFAAFQPIAVPSLLGPAAALLGLVLLFHFAFIGLLGRLPRWAGFCLLGAYGAFCYFGLA